MQENLQEHLENENETMRTHLYYAEKISADGGPDMVELQAEVDVMTEWLRLAAEIDAVGGPITGTSREIITIARRA